MAGLGAGKLLNVATPASPEQLLPQILWASAVGFGPDANNCDLGKFPSLGAIRARMQAKPAMPLYAFAEAARMARERILILDSYLFRPDEDVGVEARITQILEWLPLNTAVKQVKILTAGCTSVQRATVQKAVQERIEGIRQQNQKRAYQTHAEINWQLEATFGFVHDRFAVIDDEMWHFGATIGGLHAKVSAASRGWKAEEHDAVRFFNEAWAGESGLGRRRRHG